MNRSSLIRSVFAAVLASIVSTPTLAGPVSGTSAGVDLANATAHENGPLIRDARGRILYTVLLDNVPAALYHGAAVQRVAGLPKITQAADGTPDLDSSAAKAYVSYLDDAQTRLLAQWQRKGIAIQAVQRYQVALNGVTAWISAADARKIADLPQVQLVHPVTRHKLLTAADLIGAPEVWFGSPNVSADVIFRSGFEGIPPSHRGEGVVIGDLDSGINFASHSFDVTSPSGFTISNPLGSGNFLGWCNPGFAPASGQTHPDPCSAKIIGSYDFAFYLTQIIPQTFDYRGAMDEAGHGSHTASTAAGVTRPVNYAGYDLTISGVAPRANLVAYDVCIEGVKGGCYGVSSSAAVEQAIQDGVVDVINYSIAGGSNPWVNPTARAFLSAMDNGIFVAAAAGNAGPAPGTAEHLGPWVTTVAATTHARQPIHWAFAVPGAQYYWFMGLGTAGTKPDSGLPAGTMTILSPRFGTADDGCMAYPAGTFLDADGDGAVALINKGGCDADIKASHAAAAGAIMVTIANDVREAFKPLGEPAASIPVFGTSKQAGALFASLLASPAAAIFPYPGLDGSQQPDVVVGFSSRGPGFVSVLKPDLAAPGYGIVGAWRGGRDGEANALNDISGTSMATPQVAGAAALIIQSHPDWSPMEVKSALMLTARRSGQLRAPNGTTPAIPFDAGAGRIRVDQAINAGLVMDESGIAMLRANPATGGKPATLNLASLYDNHCIANCAFTRYLTGALDHSQTWNISADIAAPLTVTATPGITALPGVSTPIGVGINASAVTMDDAGYYFGKLTLTAAGNPETPVLHMPIAIRIPPARIQLSPLALTFTLDSGASDSAQVTIDNLGGVPLVWSSTTATGAAPIPLLNQQPGSLTGYSSSRFTPVEGSIYEADDFIVSNAMKLKTLTAYGFQNPASGNLAGVADSITFTVYADASGKPAGVPGVSGTPVYSCTVSSAGAPANGLGFGDDVVTLDVAAAAAGAAGCPAMPALAVGTYWLTVYPTYNLAAGAIAWYQYSSETAHGSHSMVVSPTQGLPNWKDTSLVFTDNAPVAMAMRVVGGEDCGASWFSWSPASGQVAVEGSVTVSLDVDSAGLVAGTYHAYACLASNDPIRPVAFIPVTLTVQP